VTFSSFFEGYHIFRHGMMQNMQLWPKIMQNKASETISVAWRLKCATLHASKMLAARPHLP